MSVANAVIGAAEHYARAEPVTLALRDAAPVFGSNSRLRAIAEVYARNDAQPVFVRDFVAA